jgi:hypothetical protein
VVSCPADLPIDLDSIYYFDVFLEDVDKTWCFYEPCTDEQPASLYMLKYSDKRRVALGQCRIKASQDTLVIALTTMYVNRILYGTIILTLLFNARLLSSRRNLIVLVRNVKRRREKWYDGLNIV